MRRSAFAAGLVLGCALLSCKQKGCPKGSGVDSIERPPPGSSASPPVSGRKAGRRPPPESDCGAQGGTCVARHEARECTTNFYSHACADEGSDQPLCCIAKRKDDSLP